MKSFLNLKRFSLVPAFVILTFLLAACSGAPPNPSWSHYALSLDGQNLVFANLDRVVMLDPLDGTLVEQRDANGQVRLDDQGVPRSWTIVGDGSGGATSFYNLPLQLDETTLLVPSYEKRFFEVDLATARILNPTGIPLEGHVVANPTMNEDGSLVYFPFSERNVAAVRTSDYTVAWTHETQRGVWADALVVDGVVYIASLDHNLYALNSETGEVLWALDLEGALPSAPLFFEDHLYIGSMSSKIFKISLDGAVVGEYATNNWVWSTPTIVDGVLYASDMTGHVYALAMDGNTFTPVWEPRQVATRAIRTTPLVYGDVIIVGSRDHFLYWLNRETGEEIFKREMGGEILSDLYLLEPSETLNVPEPLVLAGTMSVQESLVAFTLDNGERLWRYGR